MSTTNTYAILAADGNTAAFEAGADINTVSVYLTDGASDGGGTLKMQSSFDGGTTWVDVPSASWTSGDGRLGVYTVYGRDIRFNLASATSPTNMNVTVKCEPIGSSVERFALTANGSTDMVIPRKSAFAVFLKGTFDSGSLTITESPDGAVYFDSGYTAVTAAGGASLANTGGNALFKLVLASVTTAAVLDVIVLRSVV